ncbi:tetratricopeptide repeat protein [Pseudoalteromonas sp. MelDa3]|uniref:tetratricopeptide repeat protein n=1 Tax=Pseudoalteromonas sp. MelDa3 TaxID=888435 RepID=UPI000CC381C8|nr:tetratricopeptide repeat protein [Pseudoalteromonas sp. MelDa3]PLT25800.1 sel1 repeat family protein [Pseudoalteromonas sp. MelDa3]
MLLFNTSESFPHFAQITRCPHCQSDAYHLVNKSRYLRFSILPMLALKLSYKRECYQCGKSEPVKIPQLPLIEKLSLPKYFIGVFLLLWIISFFYQQHLDTETQKQSYLNTPKIYDTYLVHADKFTHEPWTLTNLRIAQVLSFDKQFITFQISNYSYKRNNSITLAMRTSQLIQDNYFSTKTITLPRDEVKRLYKDEAIYDVLRPYANSLYGGFVMFPPKPKPLYKGLKLDKNNQQGIIYFKDKLLFEAFNSFKLAAEAGSQWGQLNLAQMYRDGQGIAQNYQQAIYWYKKAIEQKNTKAQFELESLCKIANCE